MKKLSAWLAKQKLLGNYKVKDKFKIYENGKIMVTVSDEESQPVYNIKAKEQDLYAGIQDIDVDGVLSIYLEKDSTEEKTELDFNNLRLGDNVILYNILANKIDFAELDVVKMLNERLNLLSIEDIERDVKLDLKKQSKTGEMIIMDTFTGVEKLSTGALGIDKLSTLFFSCIMGYSFIEECCNLKVLDLSSIKELIPSLPYMIEVCEGDCYLRNEHTLKKIIVNKELAYIMVQIMQFNKVFEDIYTYNYFSDLVNNNKFLIGYSPTPQKSR